MRRVTMQLAAAAGTALGMMLAVGAHASASTPTQLLLPQSTAFSILGYDCGGIKEQAYATGFDATSGYPTGDVYLQTTCSAGGKGGHSTTISGWGSATWDFTGAVVSAAKLSSAPSVNPTFSAFDSHGNEVYNSSGNAYLVLAPGFVPTPRVTGILPTFGVSGGGTSVTISGTGFTAATAVDFGTASVGFTITNDTSITTTSPPSSPGVVDVTVTSSGGTSATSARDQFTFYGQPSVSGVSPNRGPVTGDYTINVTGKNFTGTSAVMFGDAAAGYTVVSDGALSVFVPPSDSPPGDNVDITVTSPGGTSPITAADQFTYTSSATASVSPTSGPPGTVVRVSGRGFSPGETVRVRYMTGLPAPKPASTALCSGLATTSGTFTCKGTIPKVNTGAKGLHTIAATGSASLTRASTTFNVT